MIAGGEGTSERSDEHVTTADPIKSGNISKDSLKTAADDARSATETLQSDLKDLGKPNTQAGQQAKDTVDKLSSDLQADVDTIKTAVDGASGISGVADAVKTATTTCSERWRWARGSEPWPAS